MNHPNGTADRPGNLPLPLNTFIGRKQARSTLKQLLSGHRLLTLTGAGGCGKTRLAIHLARDMQADYPQGAWIIELAALSEAKLLPQLVASTLGVLEQAGQPHIQTVVNFLQRREILLLVDNCEHLILACAQLSQTLLQKCPHVQILATSREPLGVPGEVVWPVPPLSLPERRPWRSPESEQESLAAYQKAEAMQLFVDRARTAAPHFNLNSENGPWVANICRRLDGIPLAIELAAAQLRFLSARQIAERLDNRFQLLTSSVRTALERQQTLQATLDWSYTLLSPAEQHMLNTLSVFANGWTLEAAEAVCCLDQDHDFDTMTVLGQLVDKSLVVARPLRSRKRYNLLETIRHYAQIKLEATAVNRAQATSDRHLDYFVTWAEKGAGQLAGPQQAEWLDRFSIEHDNLRAALDWSLQSPENYQKGLRLAAACGQFWKLRGYLAEGRDHLARALQAAGEDADPALRALALLWSANIAYIQSDYDGTRRLAEAGLAINRRLGSQGKAGTAWALDLLGELATEVGDYQTAHAHLQDALAIYRQIGQKRGQADMLMQLGWAAMRQGDYDRAAVLLHESLPLFQDLEESALLGLVLAGLGELAIRQDHYEEARQYLQESLDIRQALQDRWGSGTAYGSLGWLALRQRDFAAMRDYLRQSLEIRQEIGDQGGLAWCLEKAAEGIVLQAQTLPATFRRRMRRRAVRILSAAAALRAEINSIIDPADQREHERLLNKLRRSLGQTAFDAARQEGNRTPLAQIIESALAQPELDLSAHEVEGDRYGGLTPRERETAVHIAQGKSNRQIAQAMTVREKTIETYVTRILNKLGFNSRVQIATWAFQSGLAEPDSIDPNKQ